MPSPRSKARSRSRTSKTASAKQARPRRRVSAAVRRGVSQALFVPLLTLTFIVWAIYRLYLPFPVWFDEIIAKAIFFGFPVWIYISATGSDEIPDTFAPGLLQPGLLLGVAVGGVFGFASAILGLLQGSGVVQAAPLFVSNLFWWQFFLALMTGFWETLFFFSWIMTAIVKRFANWPLVNQVILTAAIFLVFHVPNILVRFSEMGFMAVAAQMVLLFFFAVGQAVLFSRWRNLYALTLSHAIWGMVLYVHVSGGAI